MNIYIKWSNDTESIKLPINPESFTLSDGMSNTTVTVHGFGEINLKGKRGLKEITLASFFPDRNMISLRTPTKSRMKITSRRLRHCLKVMKPST